METRRIVQVALGSAAIMLTIMTIFNTAWAARMGHRYVAPITSFGDTDDGYVRGLEKLGIVQTSRKYAATFIITVAALGSTATFSMEIPTDDR